MTDRWVDVFDAWAAAVTEAADEPPPPLYRAPASEAEIVALETRLGTTLPPSYRAFLSHSNGAAAFPGWGVVNHGPTPEDETGLLPAAEVGWLRDVDRGMVGGIDAFPIDEEIGSARHPSFDSMGSERDYLYPEGTNDPGDAKGGHLRYVLAITVNVDGYMTLLDPLVVDADGEWEAWDYGTKLPGAVRHASFGALLEADTRRSRMEIATTATQRENAAGSAAVLADSERPAGERIEAAWSAFSGGARQELVPGLAELARSEAVDFAQRATAVKLLGFIRTPDAIAVLTEIARDPDPRLRANAIGPLAISDDPAAREVAIQILADPSTPGFVLGAAYRPAGPVVWEAYRRSGNKALLPRLAYLGEERAIDDVVAAIRDLSAADLEMSWDPLTIRTGSDLLTYAYYLRDPRIAAALADAADRFPTWRASIARHLVSMGAAEQAVPMLREAILDGDVIGVAAQALGDMDGPEAGAALVEAARSTPTTSLVGALAWHPSAAAVGAIEPVLDQTNFHLVGIDSLEMMPIPEAGDVLAARSAAGDRLATRALARRRDIRCREPLLAWLDDPSARVAFDGAAGLRDLRDPTTATVLLTAVGHDDPDVAVTATHALIAMESDLVPAALATLQGNADARARVLAARWLALQT